MTITLLDKIWAETGSKANPEDTEIGKTEEGWLPSERPAMEWQNYIQNRDENKINEVVEEVNGVTGIVDLTASAGGYSGSISKDGISFSGGPGGAIIKLRTEYYNIPDFSAGYTNVGGGVWRYQNSGLSTGISSSKSIPGARVNFMDSGQLVAASPTPVFSDVGGIWYLVGLTGTVFGTAHTPSATAALWLDWLVG